MSKFSEACAGGAARTLILPIVAGYFALAHAAPAAEEILEFSSRIEVRENSDLVVTETIRVAAEGRDIRRGIYRDFPTLYSGPLGLKSRVPFQVLEVRRDGRPEPWHSERRGNGTRIYLGDANTFLRPGEITYTLAYRTSRQIGHFEGYDELYWNVTGNGWKFPIRRASVEIDLPPGAEPMSLEAFTGRFGEKGAAYAIDKSRPAALATTAALLPGDGLTVVVTWPKGFVQIPPAYEAAATILASNIGLVLGAVGLLAALAYFLLAWSFVGRDPQRGTIIPRFAPPDGLAPQDVRFLDGLGTCDNTSFTAAVLGLAVDGSLQIKESDNKIFQLERIAKPQENSFFDELFGGSKTLVLKPENHAKLTRAKKVLRAAVEEKAGGYFVRNTRVWVIGLVAALIPLAVSLLDAREPAGAAFMFVWLTFWSIGCAAISLSVFSTWRGPNRWAAIPVALFSIPFLAGWVFGLWALVNAASLWVSGLYLAGIVMCSVFQHLLKRPTPEGQALRDQIRGFRHYLSVAEADRLDLENPPERTPEHFEAFLPYALALGVEQAWSEKFADILDDSARLPEARSSSGILRSASAAAFAGALGGAISSASTSPGSRSGSGGGGSSGGGGGGGGGGGW